MLRDEGAQGLVAFTLGIPTALVVLQAGVWADRHDRRRLLIGTQLASAAVMAGTALLIRSDHIEMGWVIIATLLAGTASAVGQPVRSRWFLRSLAEINCSVRLRSTQSL